MHCDICGEIYQGMALDCRCTNYGVQEPVAPVISYAKRSLTTRFDAIDELQAAYKRETIRWTGEDWEDPQSCGCVIYRRPGDESCRVMIGCPTHRPAWVLDDKGRPPRLPLLPESAPVLVGRARLAFDEEV